MSNLTKNPILILSDELSNMIAAGEVVERPLSVVKELVENSIDAKASSIKIELQDSGLKSIKVIDNGLGISKEEIPIAIKRHATSKISSKNDLFSITSLGFRGEALPSIASVSKMRITSSIDGSHGYFYEFISGKINDEGIIAYPRGTKIEVFDLFYNTPARYKHLSNLSQELSQIMNYINRLVIAYPTLALSISNNDRLLLQTLGDNDISNIIAQTYGTVVAKNMIQFNGENNLYKISGYTSKNNVFRSNKNSINIIVNQRIIRNQQLIYAITDSYKSILPTGKYPITILEIQTDPSIIDVNVHPSKLEIRFTDELNLKRLITKTINDALLKTELIYEEHSNDYPSTINRINESSVEELKSVLEEKQEFSSLDIDKLWNQFDSADPIITTSDFDETKEEVNKDLDVSEAETFEQQKTEFSRDFFEQLSYIGQYNKTYLLLEHDNNLYLIDQHAAMERIMYEKISKSFALSSNEKFDLLVPITLDYNSSEVLMIEQKLSELKRMGFDTELFGNTSIIIRSVPTWVPRGNETEFIRDIIQHLLTNQKTGKDKLLDNLAKMLSCKKSIKAHMAITEQEVQHLLKNLDSCQMPYTCPHGRPTLIKLSLYEIEKLFKRVI